MLRNVIGRRSDAPSRESIPTRAAEERIAEDVMPAPCDPGNANGRRSSMSALAVE